MPETHPAPSQFRLYVYDDYSRPFIPKGFTSRIVLGDASIAFRPAGSGAFLDANVPQLALPASIVVKARFEGSVSVAELAASVKKELLH